MSYRKSLIPAIAVALCAFAALPASADAPTRHVHASGRHHGNHGWNRTSYHSHHRHHGNRHYRRGIRTLRTLPILIGPDRDMKPSISAARAPGVPDAVPYTRAGPGRAVTGGSYIYGGDALPSSVPAGTYAGGIDAVYFPGNGTYIAVDGNVLAGGGTATERPSAKIITVTPEIEKAACQMEKGVCIIRP